MKTVKIVPNICKAEGSPWSGHVIMRLPTFDEKFEYLESLGVEVSQDGAVESKSKMEQFKQIRHMVAMSKKHYAEVNLVNKETGESVVSFEDMQYVDALHNTMVELSGMMLNGFKLGNG